jgi:hypothetical protein
MVPIAIHYSTGIDQVMQLHYHLNIHLIVATNHDRYT